MYIDCTRAPHCSQSDSSHPSPPPTQASAPPTPLRLHRPTQQQGRGRTHRPRSSCQRKEQHQYAVAVQTCQLAQGLAVHPAQSSRQQPLQTHHSSRHHFAGASPRPSHPPNRQSPTHRQRRPPAEQQPRHATSGARPGAYESANFRTTRIFSTPTFLESDKSFAATS